MSPLDDELRAALHGRATVLTPSPDPLAGIERRARRMRRNRAAAAVAGSVLAVAAIALVVPALSPGTTPSPGPGATSPEPSASASLSPDDPAFPVFSFDRPWPVRGDLGVAAVFSRAGESWASGRGVTADDVRFVVLYGEVHEPSGADRAVYAAEVRGGGVREYGLVVSRDDGPAFLSQAPLTDSTTALVVPAPGDEGVPSLLVVAAPDTARIEYAPGGEVFRPMTAKAAGVAVTALDGDDAIDLVQVVGPGGDNRFRGPVPAFSDGADGTADAPDNLLDWPSRGVRSEGPDDEALLAAFGQGVPGGGTGAATHYRALFSGSTDAGVRFTYGQAWADGGPAYTVGLATGGTSGDQLFLGPVTPDDPQVLAFSLCCEPGSTTETLVVVPVPGTGQVLYGDDETGEFRPVGAGQDGLDGVVLIDRDPRAQGDRLRLLDGNGDLDAPTFTGEVFSLLCGLTSCG